MVYSCSYVLTFDNGHACRSTDIILLLNACFISSSFLRTCLPYNTLVLRTSHSLLYQSLFVQFELLIVKDYKSCSLSNRTSQLIVKICSTLLRGRPLLRRRTLALYFLTADNAMLSLYTSPEASFSLRMPRLRADELGASISSTSTFQTFHYLFISEMDKALQTPEILDLIFQQMVYIRYPNRWPDAELDRQALARCARVNRLWSSVSLAILWRKIAYIRLLVDIVRRRSAGNNVRKMSCLGR